MVYDLCIVGAGVSGIAAAITASKSNSRILLLEKNSKIGKKIYATGNGRCNITNTSFDYSKHYNSTADNYVEFLKKAIGSKPYEDVKEYISSLGIVTEDVNGYIYPSSRQASAVVWAMSDALKNKVNLALETQVNNIKKDDIFKIYTNKDTYFAKKVILACGGKSYLRLGGSDLGYRLAQNLGHSIITPRPTLCGMLTKEKTKSISGVRAICDVEITVDGKKSIQSGEVQFTDYGISGIVIFNLASKIGKAVNKNKTVDVFVDFMPAADDITLELLVKNNYNRTVLGMLNGIINDKLAAYIIEMSGCNPKDTVQSLNKNQLDMLFDSVRRLKFVVCGLRDFDNAQVTAGGVDINEINPLTFMSKHVKDLYIVGEVTDIDGICGGYNISYAVLSGIKAGKMCNDKNK